MGHEARKDRRGGRRWFAVGLATVLMFLSYTMFIFGFAAASEDETIFAGGLVGIAIGLVPAVFFAAALLSHRERAVRASLLATVLFFVIAGPIAVLDIPTGMVTGFGVGAILTVRRTEHHLLSHRAAAVAICVVYTFAVQRIAPAAGLMVGALVPFVAVALADVASERESEQGADAPGVTSP